MKKSLLEIGEDVTSVSDKISTQVRAVMFGVLAIAWLGLSGSDLDTVLNQVDDRQLAMIAILCIVTLGIDWFQYLCGYLLCHGTLDAAEKANQSEAAYSKNSRWFKRRIIAFWAKQGLAVVSAVWLIVLLGCRVLAN